MIQFRLCGSREDCATALLQLMDLFTGLHEVALRRDRDGQGYRLYAAGHLARHERPAVVATRLAHLITTGRLQLAPIRRGPAVVDLTNPDS